MEHITSTHLPATKVKKTLYSQDIRGGIKTWTIEVLENVYKITYTCPSGAVTTESVEYENLNVGTDEEKSGHQVAMEMAEALVVIQQRRGNVASVDDLSEPDIDRMIRESLAKQS